MDVDLQSQDGRVSKSSVVGNEFLRGPSFSRATRPIFVRTNGTYSLFPGSRVYVNDNRAPDSGSTYSELVTLTGGDVIPNLMTQTTAPVWNTGLVVRKTTDSAVYSRVLSYAGARPTDRDSVDKRIVLERAQSHRSDHQLRVARWHHALQQECRRLADIRSESSDIDAAVESGIDRLQRLQQSRELAEFHGSVHGWRGAGRESCIAAGLVSAMTTRAG